MSEPFLADPHLASGKCAHDAGRASALGRASTEATRSDYGHWKSCAPVHKIRIEDLWLQLCSLFRRQPISRMMRTTCFDIEERDMYGAIYNQALVMAGTRTCMAHEWDDMAK